MWVVGVGPGDRTGKGDGSCEKEGVGVLEKE